MPKRWQIAASVAALVLGLWLFYDRSAWISGSGQSAPLYSSVRFDPAGAAALCDLLELRGGDVQRLRHPYLFRRMHGTLVQILARPDRVPFAEHDQYEIRAPELLAWISEGNTVVQMSRDYTELMGALAIPKGREPGDLVDVQALEHKGANPDQLDSKVVRAHGVDPLLPEGAKIELVSPRIFGEKGPRSWKPLARDEKGGVVIGEVTFGRGRLIVVGAPTPALNGWLAREGNLESMLALCGRATMVFDDWSHGVGQAPTVMQLIRQAGLELALWQLGFVLVLYFWSTRGHGRFDVVDAPRRRSSIEQIQTLAYLYGRSLPAAEMHHRVEHEAMNRIAQALRCRPVEIESKLRTLGEADVQQVAGIRQALHEGGKSGGRRADSAYARALTQSHLFLRNYKREHH